MAARRLYVMGAAGTGTTSLGLALARRFGVPHVDTDRHFWRDTDPPFTARRPPAERRASLGAALGPDGWVISGACEDWASDLVAEADLVVFLTLPAPQRLIRLRQREAARFGPRIAPGGDMEAIHRSFLDWAMSYDDADAPGRSRARHEAWLARQPAPVLRLEAAQPLEALTRAVPPTPEPDRR